MAEMALQTRSRRLGPSSARSGHSGDVMSTSKDFRSGGGSRGRQRRRGSSASAVGGQSAVSIDRRRLSDLVTRKLRY
ncbi:hypothetical protein M6B38_287770 [Iris pallida]|uniref:Uncharacterized protein n=1 Tax=Iris pallida TaxID=29817 RepID=A0AAX6HX05_IRIPA|nr:hypothetical protein M6B38_287770 [Iris pallida]